MAVLAGRINFERKINKRKWGMIDSFILATSLIYGLNILSRDSDFGDLQNVEILPKS
jgi:predicted nucleic acid-binding protein